MPTEFSKRRYLVYQHYRQTWNENCKKSSESYTEQRCLQAEINTDQLKRRRSFAHAVVSVWRSIEFSCNVTHSNTYTSIYDISILSKSIKLIALKQTIRQSKTNHNDNVLRDFGLIIRTQLQNFWNKTSGFGGDFSLRPIDFLISKLFPQGIGLREYKKRKKLANRGLGTIWVTAVKRKLVK